MKKIQQISLVTILILTGCGPHADQPYSRSIPLHSSQPPTTGVDFPSPTAASTEPSTTEAQTLTSGTKGELSYSTILALTVRDLALRLHIELEDVKVLSIVSVYWPDGGLGCPLPGMDYTQVITPGYRITLEVEGKTYTYHTNTGRALILCLEDGPRLPLIPFDPDEIMDGIPWMPVDPIPTPVKSSSIADPDPIKQSI